MELFSTWRWMTNCKHMLIQHMHRKISKLFDRGARSPVWLLGRTSCSPFPHLRTPCYQSKRFWNSFTRLILFWHSATNSLNLFFLAGWAISRCLSTTPHPIWGQGGRILLVHYSMIVLKPAILIIMAVVRYNHTPIYRLPCCFRIQPGIITECQIGR